MLYAKKILPNISAVKRHISKNKNHPVFKNRVVKETMNLIILRLRSSHSHNRSQIQELHRMLDIQPHHQE